MKVPLAFVGWMLDADSVLLLDSSVYVHFSAYILVPVIISDRSIWLPHLLWRALRTLRRNDLRLRRHPEYLSPCRTKVQNVTSMESESLYIGVQTPRVRGWPRLLTAEGSCARSVAVCSGMCLQPLFEALPVTPKKMSQRHPRFSYREVRVRW